MLNERLYDDKGKEIGRALSEPFEIELGVFYDGYQRYLDPSYINSLIRVSPEIGDNGRPMRKLIRCSIEY